MIEKKTNIRVRYGETDQMGICNNANYLTYYEIGRTDLFRQLGMPYKEIEEKGYMMPLSDLTVKYIKPAYYDENLTIISRIPNYPKSRIIFEYEIFNEKMELINRGITTLAFVNSRTNRPTRIPALIKNLLDPYFRN